MTITFVGNDVPISRIDTGFWSLDNACMNQMGEHGLAVPAFVELYGDNGIGKTAFATTIAGIIAKSMKKDVAFLDWELQDFQTIIHILENHGFSGTLQKILEKQDEKSLDKFYDIMEDEKYGVGIMDSIASFISVGEMQGKQSDSNMGKQGWNMAKFSRTTIRNMQLRKSPAVVICTNHMHPVFGSRVNAIGTSGGVTKEYMTTYRFLLKKLYWNKKTQLIRLSKDEPPIGWVIEGRLDKNRTGFAFTKFHVVMIMGEGLHVGFSALYDCLINGYAELDRVVKMDDTSYGNMVDFIRNRNDDKIFKPFIDKLKTVQPKAIASDDDSEDEDD